MDVLILLIPVTLILGGGGLAALIWTLRHNQYEDPAGNAARILTKDYDERPHSEDPARD